MAAKYIVYMHITCWVQSLLAYLLFFTSQQLEITCNHSFTFRYERSEVHLFILRISLRYLNVLQTLGMEEKKCPIKLKLHVAGTGGFQLTQGYNCYLFLGVNCQIRYNPCSKQPCQNGGLCNIDGEDYVCTCPLTYTGNNFIVVIVGLSPIRDHHPPQCKHNGIGRFAKPCYMKNKDTVVV